MIKKLICLLMTFVMLTGIVACNEGDTTTNGGKDAYTLTYKSCTIKIDDKAQAVLNTLGTPKIYHELPTCGKGDLDKLFDYGSVRIRTYQIEGIDYISVIELMDDLVQTNEGVAIGESLQAVLDAYGEADKKTAVAWIYDANGMDLEFHFNESQNVKSIIYRGEN